MRYVTFSTASDPAPRIGVLDGPDVVDLQSLSGPVSGSLPRSVLELIDLGPAEWSRVATVLKDALPRRDGSRHELTATHLHAPIPRPAKNVFALGLNYKSHAIESATARGREIKIPTSPVFFTKASTSVSGPHDDIPVDRSVTQQADWEVELGVVMGVRAKNVERGGALRHVFGYTIVNDVSARDVQAKHLQWFKGKSLDGFCPMGPCIVTADEFGDPQNKQISLRVNGVTKQSANTREMIFPIDVIIESLSHGMTVDPGDIIATGTPEGIGLGFSPPQFLQDGDIVETEIEGIGMLRNPVPEIK